jgi:hypothetical protein
MAAAEATAPNGTLLGALITLLLYGVLPLSIVMYVLGTPARRQARLRAESAALAAAVAVAAPGGPGPAAGDSAAPDDGRVAAGDAITPERKEA